MQLDIPHRRGPHSSKALYYSLSNLGIFATAGNWRVWTSSPRHHGRRAHHKKADSLRQQQDIPVGHGDVSSTLKADMIQPQIHSRVSSHTPALPIPCPLPGPARLLQIRPPRLPLPRLQRQMLQHPIVRQANAGTRYARTTTALVPRGVEEIHDSRVGAAIRLA